MAETSEIATADVFAPDYAPAILYDALSHETCAHAIAVAERVGFERSVIYSTRDGQEDDPEVRNSESVYVSSSDLPEVYYCMSSIVQKMNGTLYRFQLTGLEPIQIIRYRGGGFFSDHVDIGGGRAANRKLSVIVQLSDDKDYEGGDVAVFGGLTVPRARGWGVVFPSWVPHRVEKLTSGTRYALVTWAVGNFFV